MDTILNYLNNMFAHMPDTEQVRKAKEDLAAMMEDKYNELLHEGKTDNEAVGIVISEFGNLDELSKELGLDGVEQNAPQNTKFLSDREAREYVEVVRKNTGKIAIGVFLCICSPIILIILGGLSDMNYIGISEDAAGYIGLAVLFLMIAVAVVIFIFFGSKMERYDYLKRTSVQIPANTQIYFRNLLDQNATKNAIYISVGVAMILCGVLVLILSGLLGEAAAICSVGILLFIVAIAVMFFIQAGSFKEPIQVLLQEADYSPENKRAGKLMDSISGVYWTAATVIYFIWSFTTMDWWISWIVWPIAGVCFGLIAAICAVIKSK